MDTSPTTPASVLLRTRADSDTVSTATSPDTVSRLLCLYVIVLDASGTLCMSNESSAVRFRVKFRGREPPEPEGNMVGQERR